MHWVLELVGLLQLLATDAKYLCEIFSPFLSFSWTGLLRGHSKENFPWHVGQFPNTLGAVESHGMQVTELYYHSSACDSAKQTEAYSEYIDRGYVQLPFSNEWLLGERYSSLVQHVKEREPVDFYFSADLDTNQKLLLKQKYSGFNNQQKSKKKSWKPLGELINFGDPEYKYDDRSYLL